MLSNSSQIISISVNPFSTNFIKKKTYGKLNTSFLSICTSFLLNLIECLKSDLNRNHSVVLLILS